MTSLHNTSSHTPPNRRKKLTTIIFDTDFFIRPKTRLLIKKFGITAPSIYLTAICWMAYESSSDRLDSSTDLRLLCLDTGVDYETAVAVLDECVELDMLRYENGFYISDRLASELDAVAVKQNNYRSAALGREKAKRSKIKNSLGRASKSEQVRKEQEKEQEQEEEKDQEREREKEPPSKLEHAPGVFLTIAEREKVISAHGEEFFNRCCEKLSAWIAQDPTPKRKRNGRNAAATFRVWVINAVSDEDTRRARAGPLPNGLTREFKSFAQLEHERKMKILEEICDDAN